VVAQLLHALSLCHAPHHLHYAADALLPRSAAGRGQALLVVAYGLPGVLVVWPVAR
jgi:hypothetical protein